MRRFWAHITIVLTALLLMGSTFFMVFSKASMNMDYKEGREITLRLTDKENEDAEITSDEGAIKTAQEMKTRLDTVGVTAYNVFNVGNDIVKVQLAEPSNANINNIITYLGFNGSFGLSNMDDNENYTHITGEEFLQSKNGGDKVYLDNINNYPTIVIPVDTESPAYQELIEKTEKQKDEGVGEQTSTGEKDENGNEKTETHTYLYLWYDFNEETDRYSRTVEGNDDYDVNIARKIIMKFDIDNKYYPDDQNNKLAFPLTMDSDGDDQISVNEVRDSYNKARLYVNILNAGELDYKLTYVNDEKVVFVPANSESLINNSDPHQYLAWSRTLIATICAILIVSLLLAVFFKLSTLSIVPVTLVSIFASIGFMVLMSAEFNIAALIGLVAVALASLASGIIYASKLKQEIYKGRTLKKANAEASKKSLLPTLDIHVALLLIGVFTYLLGGGLMRSFALISVVGGLASFIVSSLGLKGLMWLLTNNTSFIKKPRLFGVEEDKIPTATEESKLVAYKGSYADKDLGKHHRKIGIASLALFAASLAGLITFGILGNNQPFTLAKTNEVSEVMVYSKDELVTIESLKEGLLSKITVYSSSSDTEGKTLDKYVSNEIYYAHTETVDAVEQTTYYFEFKLNKVLSADIEAMSTFAPTPARVTLAEALSEYSSYINSKTTAGVKTSGNSYVNDVNFGGIVAGTSIAIGVAGLYFLLRYRLSRGLIAMAAPIVTTAIGVGVFVLTRLAFPAATPVLIPVIALFTMIIMIMIMDKDRELFLESKIKSIGYDDRHAITKEAVGMAFDAVLVFSIVACYIGVNFFGFGPNATSLIFIVLTVAIILATFLVVNQFASSTDFIYRRVAALEVAKPAKAKKKNKKIVSSTHRSSEPEEATFIGIND